MNTYKAILVFFDGSETTVMFPFVPKKGDFIYFDPPYHPLSKTSSFTGYGVNGFSEDEQVRLHRVYSELDKRGCFVMLSNSATDFIYNLYHDFNVKTIQANRNINSNATCRGKIDEV